MKRNDITTYGLFLVLNLPWTLLDVINISVIKLSTMLILFFGQIVLLTATVTSEPEVLQFKEKRELLF